MSPHGFVFDLDGTLVDNIPFHMEAFALAGARRTVLQIAGVAHTNPIPMGVRIGWLVGGELYLDSGASYGAVHQQGGGERHAERSARRVMRRSTTPCGAR